MLMLSIIFIGICIYFCIKKQYLYNIECAIKAYDDKYSQQIISMLNMIKKHRRVVEAILHDARHDTPLQCAKKWELSAGTHEEKTMKAIELLDEYSEDLINFDKIEKKLKNIKFQVEDWKQLEYQCLKLHYSKSCNLYMVSQNILEYIYDCESFGLKF